MPAILRHIAPTYPTHIPVLNGAAEELVTHRELRNKYETNRSIKTWGCWFLLKALTTTGKLHAWYKQKEFILPFVQMNENTFRRQLKNMEALGLAMVDDDGSINLISYERAAGILGIIYFGCIQLPYNYNKHAGKQVFQYIIRGEEIRLQQQLQLDALTYHLEKNPSLKSDLHLLLVKVGADGQRLLKDPRYYQQRLLKLQLFAFKEGTEILEYVFTHRADINRGVRSIQKAHAYKATQSVSYMKSRMATLGLITQEKVSVRSRKRSRLFIPDVNGGKKEGYKWIGARKETALFLTDQISFTYETTNKKSGQGKDLKRA